MLTLEDLREAYADGYEDGFKDGYDKGVADGQDLSSAEYGSLADEVGPIDANSG
jgi:flagellar biosynthesis/type III secretory pathway protein FliH